MLKRMRMRMMFVMAMNVVELRSAGHAEANT
jgi:hypothetical protein